MRLRRYFSPGAVRLAVLTCLEQVTNDGRGITTRKLRSLPFVPLARFLDCNTNVPVQSGGGLRACESSQSPSHTSLFEGADATFDISGTY